MQAAHIDLLWPELLRQALAVKPVPGGQGELRQISGCHIKLPGYCEQFLTNDRRKLSPIYASAELLWYLKRTHSIEMIKAYAPAYEKYAENGLAYGAYGGRIGAPGCGHNSVDLLDLVIDSLRERPHTKKAVIGLWRPEDLIHANAYKDIPCTLSWQFLNHEGKLDMIVSMRSNDLWRGFLYDTYVNTCIQRYVASRVGLPVGMYIHTAGSMHLYERDVKKAAEAVKASERTGTCYPVFRIGFMDAGWTSNQLAHVLHLEEQLRIHKEPVAEFYQFSGLPATLTDALACCELRFIKDKRRVTTPGLNYALETWVST